MRIFIHICLHAVYLAISIIGTACAGGAVSFLYLRSHPIHAEGFAAGIAEAGIFYVTLILGAILGVILWFVFLAKVDDLFRRLSKSDPH